MKRIALIAAVLFVGCSKDKTELRLPSQLIPDSVVCKDAAGIGPDITLTPPGINQQLKVIDGCRREGGRCFYNCGKFGGK